MFLLTCVGQYSRFTHPQQLKRRVIRLALKAGIFQAWHWWLPSSTVLLFNPRLIKGLQSSHQLLYKKILSICKLRSIRYELSSVTKGKTDLKCFCCFEPQIVLGSVKLGVRCERPVKRLSASLVHCFLSDRIVEEPQQQSFDSVLLTSYNKCLSAI